MTKGLREQLKDANDTYRGTFLVEDLDKYIRSLLTTSKVCIEYVDMLTTLLKYATPIAGFYFLLKDWKKYDIITFSFIGYFMSAYNVACGLLAYKLLCHG